ncbi:MAG: site-2 protease family protein [Gammaproteobacteria bacterium]|nr:site-2 protease family protein [Gammaproteobacteria bacterium]MCY4323908.1 site-2 protease family protein [Gammaproteobacteria bacterium]
MIFLLQNGEFLLFGLLIVALIISLTFHEFGHAFVAKAYGDDTAERAGRLTLNPVAHIDLFGLLLVIIVGFGYAKPVPTNPRNFRTPSADFWVAAAGPLMNLLLAIVVWNTYLVLDGSGLTTQQIFIFCLLLAQVNLLLMIFNLIPVAPLDGHYLLPYFLPERMRPIVHDFNRRFGPYALLSLVVLSLMGLPIFAWLSTLSRTLLPLISWVG